MYVGFFLCLYVYLIFECFPCFGVSRHTSKTNCEKNSAAVILLGGNGRRRGPVVTSQVEHHPAPLWGLGTQGTSGLALGEFPCLQASVAKVTALALVTLNHSLQKLLTPQYSFLPGQEQFLELIQEQFIYLLSTYCVCLVRALLYFYDNLSHKFSPYPSG